MASSITQDCDCSSDNETISHINAAHKDIKNLSLHFPNKILLTMNNIPEFNLINIILCLTFQEKLQFVRINKRLREVLYHPLCFPNVSFSATTDELNSPQLVHQSGI